MKTTNIIRFSTEDYNAMTRHLAGAGEDESFVYGLFSKARGKDCIIYLCSRLLIPDKEQLENQSRVSIVPSKEYQALTYGLGYELGMSVIDVHTHPFSKNARFSPIDLHHGIKNAKDLALNFPEDSTMGMIVLGRNFDSFEAHIWNREDARFESVSRIEILGAPTLVLTSKALQSCKSDDAYARHMIIPGWKQGLLEDLKVFVCGLGGNGALVFDSLLSLGIGRRNGWIKACDPDVLEKSNLPRIPYAYPEEVGQSKAEIAQLHADYRTPGLNVQCFKARIEDQATQAVLKEANVILGTVDNDAARMILNSFAARYLIPYIDLGTEIIPGESVYEAVGQVHAFIPGKTGCLICSGAIDPCEAALDVMDEKEKAAYEKVGYVRGTSETPTPSVLHLNGVVSHLAISQFLKMVFNDSFAGKDYVHYNRQASSLIAAALIQDDECPVCGLHGYVGQGDEDSSILEALSDLKESNAPKKELPVGRA